MLHHDSFFYVKDKWGIIIQEVHGIQVVIVEVHGIQVVIVEVHGIQVVIVAHQATVTTCDFLLDIP